MTLTVFSSLAVLSQKFPMGLAMMGYISVLSSFSMTIARAPNASPMLYRWTLIVWMRMAFIKPYILMLGPQLVELFGRIRRYELIGKGASLAAYFEVSKAHIIPVSVHTLICSPPPASFLSPSLPPLHAAPALCLPACCQDSNSLQPWT